MCSLRNWCPMSLSSCRNGFADIVAESPCLQLLQRSDLRSLNCGGLKISSCGPDHICPNKSILSGKALRKLMPLCQTSFSCHIWSWSHLLSSKRHHLIRGSIIVNQMLVSFRIPWGLYLPTQEATLGWRSSRGIITGCFISFADQTTALIGFP